LEFDGSPYLVRMLQTTLIALALQAQALHADSLLPPPVTRELRGVWVATVNNIDWPSRSDLTTGEQQQELLAIFNRAAALRLNAVILQVRPVSDALYESRYEPWSRYLTGRQGRRPAPYWDPLQFAVTEAHKRGLELHAWFNPYRVAFGRESLPARNHVSQRHPEYVVRYGNYLWMDPGIPESRRLMLRAVLDVVRRYDVDGVHIDDYFYPYPETDPGTRARIEFPDDASYAAYRRRGGTLERGDWRRNNVNVLVREFYEGVKAQKRWVKVGISPFGIWRPGNPPSIQAGIDQYDELYADVRKWLHEGWLDYLVPQLYWPITPPEQSYPVLLQWWVEENLKGRHMWPGLPLHRLAPGPRSMRADDIVQEIAITRETPGATGHVHFSARVLMQNLDSIADRLAPLYAEPALVPSSPWLDRVAPSRPTVRIAMDSSSGEATVHFAPADGQPIRHWIVQSRIDSAWVTTLLPGAERAHILKDSESAADLVSVSGVDRVGNTSPPVIIRRARPTEGG
jgi:uncharacterized lipoprotein YddW (UPF0748 family)